MTNLDASQVLVAGTGAIYRAPFGQAAPADSQAALDVAYLNMGYFSSDGVEIAFADSVNKTYGWQNSALIRSSRTETDTTLTFKPMQTTGLNLETFHQGSQVVDETGGEFSMDIFPATPERFTFLFDAIDGSNHMRWYIPNGEITERGSLMHQNGEPLGYPMTMTFYPDSTNRIARLLSNIAAFGVGIA